MQLTLLKGYPDLMGRRRAFAGYGNGPSSYPSGGDPLVLPGYESYLDAVFGGVSVSGTYFVASRPAGVGPRQAWYVKWFASSTGAEVSPGTDLSAESIQIGGFWGEY